jgi:hypothetical protein
MAAYEYETEMLPELGAAHETEAALGPALAAARSVLAALRDGEAEWESELNPVRRWYPDATLEHLAHEATEAESESEAAEAFLPLIPLVAAKLLPLAAKAAPLIAKALPKVMNVVSRVTPQLTRGVTNVARTLFRGVNTRGLLRTLPTIAQRTVGQIARQVASGRPVTPRTAVRTLARQTAAVLRRPSQIRRAVGRSRILDRRLHRRIPTGRRPLGGSIPVAAGIGSFPVGGSVPGVSGIGSFPVTAGGCPTGCVPAAMSIPTPTIPAMPTVTPSGGCGCQNRCPTCGR